jgi:hypothetical protein
MGDGRLPTALWVDAHLATLTRDAVPYYFIQKGNHSSGLLLLKLNGLKGQVRLLIQERDFMEDKLVWAAALDEETVEEKQADEYIERAIGRDPDLWVLEIEHEGLVNPFEDGVS